MQICNAKDNATFPGTGLVNCAPLAADIKTCQSKGKILTLSLGGGGASVGFQSDSDAQALADTIWNDFLGGSSATRPFGDAVLDGCVMSSAPRRNSALTGPLLHIESISISSRVAPTAMRPSSHVSDPISVGRARSTSRSNRRPGSQTVADSSIGTTLLRHLNASTLMPHWDLS